VRLLVKEAISPLRDEFVVPNSKYHAHRALILASLESGSSYIRGVRMRVMSGTRFRRYVTWESRSDVGLDGDTFFVHGGSFVPRSPDISVGSSSTTLHFPAGLATLAVRVLLVRPSRV
jgi:3-phosphoshikimate 1-carboxyvinyltransferase